MSEIERATQDYEKRIEKLTNELEVLKRTVQIQHDTINRLMDAYITKQTKGKPPVNVKK